MAIYSSGSPKSGSGSAPKSTAPSTPKYTPPSSSAPKSTAPSTPKSTSPQTSAPRYVQGYQPPKSTSGTTKSYVVSSKGGGSPKTTQAQLEAELRRREELARSAFAPYSAKQTSRTITSAATTTARYVQGYQPPKSTATSRILTSKTVSSQGGTTTARYVQGYQPPKSTATSRVLTSKTVSSKGGTTTARYVQGYQPPKSTATSRVLTSKTVSSKGGTTTARYVEGYQASTTTARYVQGYQPPKSTATSRVVTSKGGTTTARYVEGYQASTTTARYVQGYQPPKSTATSRVVTSRVVSSTPRYVEGYQASTTTARYVEGYQPPKSTSPQTSTARYVEGYQPPTTTSRYVEGYQPTKSTPLTSKVLTTAATTTPRYYPVTSAPRYLDGTQLREDIDRLADKDITPLSPVHQGGELPFKDGSGLQISDYSKYVGKSEFGDVHYIDPNVKQTTYYTYTDYDFNWGYGTDQRALYDKWVEQGRKSRNGIAVYEYNGQEYYLIATAQTFGFTGDMLKVNLADGSTINCILADSKNKYDSSYTPFGHECYDGDTYYGTNVIETERVGVTGDNVGGGAYIYKDTLDFNPASPVVSIENGGRIKDI